jgi:hypothetical protein
VGASFLGEGYRVHTIRLGAQRRQGVGRGHVADTIKEVQQVSVADCRGLSVADVRVEHEVRLIDFTKWLERVGGSPREVSGRQRIRAILGMTVSP